MSIESPDDLNGMRAAGRITAETLDALERHVKVGVTTAELDAVAASVFRRHGARSAPAMVYGFPGTVLISINDEIVHGVPGPRRIVSGDLVKLDVTVEKDGYMADAAITVPVGRVSEDRAAYGAAVRELVAVHLAAAAAAHFDLRHQIPCLPDSADSHRQPVAIIELRGPRGSWHAPPDRRDP